MCVVCVMMASDVRSPSQVQLVKRTECQARYSSYNNDSRSSTRILGVCACTRVFLIDHVMSCHVEVLTTPATKYKMPEGLGFRV